MCTAEGVHGPHHLLGQGERVRCVQQRGQGVHGPHHLPGQGKSEYVVYSSGDKRYLDLITFQDKVREYVVYGGAANMLFVNC